jgi:hypothetical protein
MCQKLLLVGYKGSTIIIRANSIQFGHFSMSQEITWGLLCICIYEMPASGL